ncbi:MAG: hypothetical protein EOL93_04235 [Epsilonproteobacteria bacterium]|nr:hypothetical protein [Campylobacterota bacterium]
MIYDNSASLIQQKDSACSVLFIGEDSSFLPPLLETLFSHVYCTNSQEESLLLFEEHEMDLVMIDTDTQQYDWRYLVHQFRLKIHDIFIGLLVDFSQQKERKALINTEASHYFFKPLEEEKVHFMLCDLLHKINAKKDTKTYHMLREKRKIHGLALFTIQRVIEEIPSPIFAYDEHEKVLFFNRSLEELFNDKKLPIPEMLHVWNIEDLFENISRELHFLTIHSGKSLDLKYCYHNNLNQKIFIPTKFNVSFDSEEESFNVIVLTDIAPLILKI